MSKEREELKKWFDTAPEHCVWWLILLADFVDKRFWGDVTIYFEAGKSNGVRLVETRKPPEGVNNKRANS